MFDLQSLIKYLLEGSAVAIAAYLIPRRQVTLTEIVLIALTAAAVFAVLDQFAPMVAGGARHGAGFGIGLQQVGWGRYGVEGFNDPSMNDPSLQNNEYEGYDDYENGEGFQENSMSTTSTDTTADTSMYGNTGNTGNTGNMSNGNMNTGNMNGNMTGNMSTGNTTGSMTGDDDIVDSQGVCNLSGDGNTCTYSDSTTTDKKGYFLCRKDGNSCTPIRACRKVGSGNTGGVQCQLEPNVEQNQSQFPDLAGRSCQSQDVNGRQQCRLTQKQGFTSSSDDIEGFEGFSKVF